MFSSIDPVQGERQLRRRIGLRGKLTAVLLAIAVVPLLVAAVLIEQTAEIAHNFASNENAFLRPYLDQARQVHGQLVRTKREVYQQMVLRAAAWPELAPWGLGEASGTSSLVLDRLDHMLAAHDELRGADLIDASGLVVLSRDRNALPERDGRHSAAARGQHEDWRPVQVEAPVGQSGAVLRMTFAADPSLESELTALHRAVRRAERIDEVRSALPSSYRNAFWVMVGGVIVLVSLTGLVLARGFTRRISALVSGTRQVASGDLTSRVELTGRDELAELAWAFNRMVDQLSQGREQIAYLQRVGAWQDVARKLAHEIKNPLTPIQLAVQQVVSSYRGDDERFLRMLSDTEEIVTEEIASLRRLVDAFRLLGKLPRVEAKPLDLGTVVQDLLKDPALAPHLVIESPGSAVTVHGDRLLLRRVVSNLVENGIDAGGGRSLHGEELDSGHMRSGSPELGSENLGSDGPSSDGPGSAGPKVFVSWHRDDERRLVVLTVDDEGPGVPIDRRETIFEPYVTSKEHGTGLGLTICRKIALDHRGELSVSAEPAPTGGARFVLSIPLAQAPGPSP